MTTTHIIYDVNENIRGNALKGHIRPTISEFFGIAVGYSPTVVPPNALTTREPDRDYIQDRNNEFVVIQY